MKKNILLLIVLLIFFIPIRIYALEGSWSSDGTQYVYEDNSIAKGIVEIDGKKYLFGINSGKMYKSSLATITEGEYAGTYYTNSEGIIQTGKQTIKNDTYYFDESGKMQKGIVEIDGNRYLYGINSGKLYKSGLATVTEREYAGTYYTNSEGIVQTGKQTIGKDTYHFDALGRMQKGIVNINGIEYLYGINSGKLYTSGLATVTEGEYAGTYYTNKQGIIQTGKKIIGEDAYYFDALGRMQKGIIELDGKRYLYGINSGKLYTSGFATVTEGEYAGTYYTNSEGIIQTGKQIIKKDSYYFDALGRMQKGIIELEGKRYLYGINSGKLYTSGFATVTEGEYVGTYYTNSEGIIQTGKQIIKKDSYYFDALGRMQKGIVELDGKRYLYGINSGKLYTSGIATVTSGTDKGTYYTNSEGVIQVGWQTIKDDKYYFDNLGRMQKGIVEIDGSKYMFGYNTGKLFKGWVITPDKKTYYTNSEGILQKGKLYIDNNWYDFDDNYVLKTGWQTINGKTYYFYADGTRAKYFVKIAGVRYEFSTTGELQHSNIKIIADLSYHNTVYDWDALWSSGEIDGVILRIGYSLGMDKKFTEFLGEARRLGIPYSVYHFSIAENSYEAQNEANSLVNWYKNNSLSPTYGVFYDIESWYNPEDGHTSDGITIADYDSIIRTYKAELNRNGIYMSLYTGKNYAETRLSDYGRDQISWIAHYATDCGYEGGYRGWQYTSKGHLPGVSGNVDLSVFYR